MTALIVALGLVVFLFLFVPFLVTFLFWYEAVTAPCPEIGTPKLSARAYVAMYLRILKGHLTGLIYHPRGWLSVLFPTETRLPTQTDRPPIVLVHGIYHNGSSWLFHKTRLEADGYPVVVYAYHSFFKSLDSILDGLEAQIRALEVRYPDQKPILVGHSLGGILLRKWLLRSSGNAARVQGLLTLATPHGGSLLATIAAGELVHSIEPSSPLIEELKTAREDASLPRVALFSDTDEMVLPSANLLPPKGWETRIVPGVTHFGFLVGQPQYDRLKTEIQRLEKPRKEAT